MENSVAKPFARPAGLILRIIALVLAIILVAVASATIGLIRSNEPLVEEAVNADDDDEKTLLLLLANTQNAASWLIFLAVCVVIGEIVAIVLLLVNVQSGRLVLDVLEIIFSFIVAFCYFATGIACALYASAWGATPEECATDEDIDCTEEAFTATNALQALFCFAQAAVFCFISSFIIYTVVIRKNSTPN